jgi:outer membrane protein assembly factor BamB
MTANPAIAPDGTIYVAQQNYIQSLTHDGEFLWRSALPEGLVIDQLFADNGGVTAYTRDGRLLRYRLALVPDPETPPVQLGQPYDTLTPLGGMLFLHSNDGTLRLYDQRLVLRGQWRDVGRPYSTAETAQMLAIATGQRSPELLLFSREGVLLQRSVLRNLANVAPAADGGMVVRTRYALWRVSPGADWTFLTDEFQVTPGASALGSDGQGSLYFYSGRLDSEFYSFASDGNPHWVVSLEQETFSPTLTLGGGCAVYLAAADGRLVAVNAATGAASEPLAIYPGEAIGGRPWLHVREDESILFAVGGTQIIAIDGRILAGLDPGAACVAPFP